jgi:hypothetical protein
MIKIRYDRVGGVIWTVLGIALAIGSIQLGFGTFHEPGPGFMPFLTGSLLGLLGLILILTKTREGFVKKRTEEISIRKFWERGIYALIASFIYIFLLEPLGYVIATLLLIFSLLKIMGGRKWFSPILISLLAVALSYFIFIMWLRISFPRGFFR